MSGLEESAAAEQWRWTRKAEARLRRVVKARRRLYWLMLRLYRLEDAFWEAYDTARGHERQAEERREGHPFYEPTLDDMETIILRDWRPLRGEEHL